MSAYLNLGWRARPQTLLSADQIKEIKKDLKRYSENYKPTRRSLPADHVKRIAGKAKKNDGRFHFVPSHVGETRGRAKTKANRVAKWHRHGAIAHKRGRN